MLELVKHLVEIDRVGDDDVTPLVWGERWLAGLIEEVLIHCFPGLTCPVPGTERSVDFKEDGMEILDDAPAEIRSPPRYELLSDEFFDEVFFSAVILLLFVRVSFIFPRSSNSPSSGDRSRLRRGTLSSSKFVCNWSLDSWD